MSMNRVATAAIQAVGGDPTQPEWEWLALKGPQGDAFTWGQTKTEPAGYVGVEHLEQIVADRKEADPDFLRKALVVVRKALRSNDVSLLRRAVQVSAVVGTDEELRVIQTLRGHQDEKVANDAKAAAFHLSRRLTGWRRPDV
jgi:formylglycine-generating enzyme required for sulfatase activity